MVSWARSTSHGEGVKYIGGGALSTVVSDLDKSIGAALLDLIVAPSWVGAGEGFGGVLGEHTCDNCNQGESLEESA